MYSLFFASIMVFSSIVNGLITTQLAVNISRYEQGERNDFISGYIQYLVIFCLLFSLCIILLYSLFRDSSWMAGISMPIVIAFTVSAGVYVLRDLLVRVAYADFREYVVLQSFLVLFVSMAAMVFVHFFFLKEMSLFMAMVFYGVGQMSALIFLLSKLDIGFTAVDFRGIKRAFDDSWSGGKWNVLSGFVYSIRTQAHNYIVPVVAGIKVLAEINASRMFVAPALLAIPPMSQVLLPRVTTMRENDQNDEAMRFVFKSTVFMVFVSMLYIVALISFDDHLVSLLGNSEYDNITIYLYGWSAYTLVLALKSGMHVYILAQRKFRNLFFINSIGAVFSVAFVYIGGMIGKGSGVVWGIFASELLLLLMYLYVYHASKRSVVKMAC